MIKVGMIGLGFMGNMHYRCWTAQAGAKLVAVCDCDADKLTGKAAVAGNIEGAAEGLDLSGVNTYSDYKEMLAKEELDAVSICLPTYLHKEATVAALEAGVNTLCEKPMALNEDECQVMIDAADKSGKILQIGHCIRFWPDYAKAKEIVDSGKYGKVQAAFFQRISATPTWSWDGWILQDAKSGGAALDLHIHDADVVQYFFGMPQGVMTQMAAGPSGPFDYAMTQYVYDNGTPVTAEGGWILSDSFGFRMAFHIVLEKATIVFDITRTPAMQVCPQDGEAFTPELAEGDGYSREIDYFTKVVSGEKMPTILTPQQSANSVRLIEAEKMSSQQGGLVSL